MFYHADRVILAECDRCGHATTLPSRHTEGWRQLERNRGVHCPRCARTARVRDPAHHRR